MDTAAIIDATGLTCPRPVLMLADGLADVAVGDTVWLTATDPTSQVDVPVWCRRHRQTLRSIEDRDGVYWYAVTRAH